MTICRGIVKGTLFGAVQTRNMFVAQIGSAEGDTDAGVMYTWLSAVWSPLRSVLASSFTTTTLETQTYFDGHWFTAEENPFVWAGTASGDQLANAVAAVLIGKVSGSYLHGRKFFSGLCESAVAGNELVGGAITTMGTVLLAYITPGVGEHGASYSPGILDKSGTFHSFSSGFVSSLLGSMRRRKPGLGI